MSLAREIWRDWTRCSVRHSISCAAGKFIIKVLPFCMVRIASVLAVTKTANSNLPFSRRESTLKPHHASKILKYMILKSTTAIGEIYARSFCRNSQASRLFNLFTLSCATRIRNLYTFHRDIPFQPTTMSYCRDTPMPQSGPHDV